MKIQTTYDPKPVLTRAWDWTAIDADTYEPGCPIGEGETESQAIASLCAQLEGDWLTRTVAERDAYREALIRREQSEVRAHG